MDAFGGLRRKTFALHVNRQSSVPRPGDAAVSRKAARRRGRNAAHDYRPGNATAVKAHKTH